MSEHWCGIHKTKFFKTANMKSYAHPIKDADGNTSGWCNEDKQAEAEAPKQAAYERQEPMINREKQSSIEAQNARTNLTNLLIADKLTAAALEAMHPREVAIVAQLYDRAGVQFGYGTYTDKHHERQEAPIVTAAKDMGAVEKPIKTLGELRERLSALGVSAEEEQKRACGLEGTEPWSNLKGDYIGAYKIAQESISLPSTR